MAACKVGSATLGHPPTKTTGYRVGDPRLRNGTTLRSRFRLATTIFATATIAGTVIRADDSFRGSEEVIWAILLSTGRSFNPVLFGRPGAS